MFFLCSIILQTLRCLLGPTGLCWLLDSWLLVDTVAFSVAFSPNGWVKTPSLWWTSSWPQNRLPQGGRIVLKRYPNRFWLLTHSHIIQQKELLHENFIDLQQRNSQKPRHLQNIPPSGASRLRRQTPEVYTGHRGPPTVGRRFSGACSTRSWGESRRPSGLGPSVLMRQNFFWKHVTLKLPRHFFKPISQRGCFALVFPHVAAVVE